MFKIYESEINDGLESVMKNNTVAYCSEATIHKGAVNTAIDVISKSCSSDVLDRVVAENKDQVDLYYLESVLVSTGWNKNDDVFDPQETWAARNTPEDKQFNFMHNENDIIGHITGSRVVDRDGNAVASDTQVQDQFDIITQAVLYTSWSNEENRNRMNRIIAEIEEGKWYVSMECLFPSFDYALTTSEGETKIVERNEASAFLTKHLRAYGGEGLYENYRIGRLLRNLAFSGKGLVSKPANPRSIILEKNDLFDESKSQILSVSSIKENSMSDSLEAKIAELQSQLDESKAANQELMEKITAEKESEYQTKIESLDSVIAEKTQEVDSLKSANETLTASFDELKASYDKKEKEMEEMKKKDAMMKRKAQLEEAGLCADEASKAVDSFCGIDDASFEAVIAVMKNKTVVANETEEKETQAEIQEELDPAEASEEVLEEAEASEEVAIQEVEPEVDPAETLRSVASEWIGSFLQSSPNNK